jgi:hypothetical protein
LPGDILEEKHVSKLAWSSDCGGFELSGDILEEKNASKLARSSDCGGFELPNSQWAGAECGMLNAERGMRR